MTFIVRCDALARYDAARRTYVTCGTQVQVDELAEVALVVCPDCGQMISVPPVPARIRPRTTNTDASRGGTTAARAPASVNPLADAADPIDPFAADDELPGRTSSVRPLDLLQLDAPLPVAAKMLGTSPLLGKPCRFCGVRLQPLATTCPSCGGGRKAIWSDDIPLDKMKVVPAGFQRSAAVLLGSGLSPQQIIFAVSLMLGVLGFSIVLALTAAGVGGLIIGFGVVLLGGLAFRLVVTESYRIARKPPARLNFLQRSVWRLCGVAIAARGWKFRGRGTGQQRQIVRDPDFDDTALLEQVDLTKIDVLVLQRTKVTDEGLRYLRGLGRLRYLHLEGTDVTDEGVFRLQQTVPMCWIWW